MRFGLGSVMSLLLAHSVCLGQWNRYIVMPDFEEPKQEIHITRLNYLVGRLRTQGITMRRQGQQYQIPIRLDQLYGEGDMLMHKTGQEIVDRVADLLDLYPSKNSTIRVLPGANKGDMSEEAASQNALAFEQASQLMRRLYTLTRTTRMMHVSWDEKSHKMAYDQEAPLSKPSVVIEFKVVQ